MSVSALRDYLEAVMRERAHSKAKWGDKPRSLAEWVLIVERELNEAKEAIARFENDADAKKELLQVVACAVNCAMENGWAERTDHHPDTEKYLPKTLDNIP